MQARNIMPALVIIAFAVPALAGDMSPKPYAGE
jgi:hypothetical protein